MVTLQSLHWLHRLTLKAKCYLLFFCPWSGRLHLVGARANGLFVISSAGSVGITELLCS